MAEMIFGYFLIWLIGSVVIGGSFLGFFIIRLQVSLRDSFVIATIIIFEVLWMLAVLTYIFFPSFTKELAKYKKQTN